MPNENISCASTGNSSQSSSTRKDRKPVRIRVSLLIDSSDIHELRSADSPGDPFSSGKAASERTSPERKWLKDTGRSPGFDARFPIYIRNNATERSALPEDESGTVKSPFERAFSDGMEALHRNILDINAPDKLIELLMIDIATTGPEDILPGIQALLEAGSLEIRQRLESCGYTLQKVDLHAVERLAPVAGHAMA